MNSRIRNPQSAIRNRTWWLVTITLSREQQEAVSSLLFDLGTTGIITFEETEQSITLGAYFTERPEAGALKREIERRAGGALSELWIDEVADDDWMQKWKEGFGPVEIGERLIVAPSWSLPNTSEGRVVIQIDPGMAFGTGTHESTRLCLEAIERCWRGNALLDVGTGTGILAIAAARLQPGSRVVAIDVDPQAVEVARENLAINGVADSVVLLEAQPRKLADQRFDVVVANLTAEVIVDLMTDLRKCLEADGLMILCGILIELDG